MFPPLSLCKAQFVLRIHFPDLFWCTPYVARTSTANITMSKCCPIYRFHSMNIWKLLFKSHVCCKHFVSKRSGQEVGKDNCPSYRPLVANIVFKQKVWTRGCRRRGGCQNNNKQNMLTTIFFFINWDESFSKGLLCKSPPWNLFLYKPLVAKEVPPHNTCI